MSRSPTGPFLVSLVSDTKLLIGSPITLSQDVSLSLQHMDGLPLGQISILAQLIIFGNGVRRHET